MLSWDKGSRFTDSIASCTRLLVHRFCSALIPPARSLAHFRKIIAQTSGMQELPAGSYIVFLAQPQRMNVLALFEPQIYPNRLGAQGEAERPYDVTGWTLPMQ